jgi:hypothetical protein
MDQKTGRPLPFGTLAVHKFKALEVRRWFRFLSADYFPARVQRMLGSALFSLTFCSATAKVCFRYHWQTASLLCSKWSRCCLGKWNLRKRSHIVTRLTLCGS